MHASTRTRRRRWSSVAGRNHDSRELIESMPRLFRSFGLIWLLKKHLGPHKSGFIFLFLSCKSRITKGRGGDSTLSRRPPQLPFPFTAWRYIAKGKWDLTTESWLSQYKVFPSHCFFFSSSKALRGFFRLSALLTIYTLVCAAILANSLRV